MALDSTRTAKIQITVDGKQFELGLSEAKKKATAWDKAMKAIGNTGKNVAKGVLPTAGKAFGVLAGGMGLEGADAGILGIASGAIAFDDALTRLQITANATPAAMRAYAESVTRASSATGISRNDILAAGSAYVALTGDMDTAQKSTAMWAKVAQATNSSIQDISATAAAMTQNLKIRPEDMEAAFSALAVQGKAGAIELKDLASQLANIAPQWAMFDKGTGLQGLKEMGAALQVVKRGFGGDASETVTGLQGLLTAITKHADKFKDITRAGGKKGVFDISPDGTKHMADVLDIVQGIASSNLVKDPQLLEKSFGRVEAYRAFLQLSQNKQVLDDLYKSASDSGTIQRDLDTYLASSAGRTKTAWESAKNELAAAFSPDLISKFADTVVSLIPKVAALAGVVGTILGKIEGAGEAIRGFLPGGGGHKLANYDDELLASQGRNSDDPEVRAQGAAALARVRDVERYNDAVDSITGAQGDDGKVTGASIKAAFAAKYNNIGNMQGGIGAADAGRSYLHNAKVVDPLEFTQQSVQMTNDAVTQAIKESFNAGIAKVIASLPNIPKPATNVKVGADTVLKATQTAPHHRTGAH